MVHHQLTQVKDLFDRVLLLNRKCMAFGNTSDVFTQKNVTQTFQTDVDF